VNDGEPRRAIRVPDELWSAAIARARSEDRTLSQLIRRWLSNYVEHGNPNPPGKT